MKGSVEKQQTKKHFNPSRFFILNFFAMKDSFKIDDIQHKQNLMKI
jgi:hypothetical protein